MARSLLTLGGLLALTSAVVAQQTTADILVPGWDPKEWSASVVGVGDDMTTFALDCDKKTICPKPATIVQGDDTWSMHTVYEDKTQTFTYDYACDIERPQMTCTISMDGRYPKGHTTRSTVDTTDGVAQLFEPIPITAGANKLKAGPTAATTTAAETTMDDEPAASQTAEPESSAPETTAAETTAAETTSSVVMPSSTSSSEDSTSAASSASESTSTPDSSSDDDDDDDNAAPKAGRSVAVAAAAAVLGGLALL